MRNNDVRVVWDFGMQTHWNLLSVGVLDTTLCDKVCQWPATCQWSNYIFYDNSLNLQEDILVC
jgi:hypothetical protein